MFNPPINLVRLGSSWRQLKVKAVHQGISSQPTWSLLTNQAVLNVVQIMTQTSALFLTVFITERSEKSHEMLNQNNEIIKINYAYIKNFLLSDRLHTNQMLDQTYLSRPIEYYGCLHLYTVFEKFHHLSQNPSIDKCPPPLHKTRLVGDNYMYVHFFLIKKK